MVSWRESRPAWGPRLHELFGKRNGRRLASISNGNAALTIGFWCATHGLAGEVDAVKSASGWTTPSKWWGTPADYSLVTLLVDDVEAIIELHLDVGVDNFATELGSEGDGQLGFSGASRTQDEDGFFLATRETAGCLGEGYPC